MPRRDSASRRDRRCPNTGHCRAHEVRSRSLALFPRSDDGAARHATNRRTRDWRGCNHAATESAAMVSRPNNRRADTRDRTVSSHRCRRYKQYERNRWSAVGQRALALRAATPRTPLAVNGPSATPRGCTLDRSAEPILCHCGEHAKVSAVHVALFRRSAAAIKRRTAAIGSPLYQER